MNQAVAHAALQGLQWALHHRGMAYCGLSVAAVITIWKGSLWGGFWMGVAAVICSLSIQAAAAHDWALCGLLFLIAVVVGKDAYRNIPCRR